MHIERIFLRTFRCFGAEIRPVTSLTGIRWQQRKWQDRSHAGFSAAVRHDRRAATAPPQGLSRPKRREDCLDRAATRTGSHPGVPSTRWRNCENCRARVLPAHGRRRELAYARESWRDGCILRRLVQSKTARAAPVFCQALGSEAKVADSINRGSMLACRRSPCRRSRRALRTGPRHIWPGNRL